jgi:hypothetical protein
MNEEMKEIIGSVVCMFGIFALTFSLIIIL